MILVFGCEDIFVTIQSFGADSLVGETRRMMKRHDEIDMTASARQKLVTAWFESRPLLGNRAAINQTL